jgi:hypothetical protein
MRLPQKSNFRGRPNARAATYSGAYCDVQHGGERDACESLYLPTKSGQLQSFRLELWCWCVAPMRDQIGSTARGRKLLKAELPRLCGDLGQIRGFAGHRL